MLLELREKYDVEKPTAFEDCILSQVGFDCSLRKDSTLLFKTGKATTRDVESIQKLGEHMHSQAPSHAKRALCKLKRGTLNKNL